MYRGSVPELYGPLKRGNGIGEVDDRIYLVFEVWAEYARDLEQVIRIVGLPYGETSTAVDPGNKLVKRSAGGWLPL